MMRNLLVFILLGLFSITHTYGQEMKKHIVQRGETLESVAQDYNLSVDELRRANFDFELFYTGLEINVPIKKTAVASNVVNQSSSSDDQFLKTLAAYREECEAAEKMFKARKYSKAQNQYRLIIKKYKGSLSCEEALYRNALCSYNREKWKSAIKDLSAVVYNKDCSPKQRDHCKSLLAKARSYRDQQVENRTNFWGGLFVTAAAVGTSVALASSQSKQSSYSSASSSSGSIGYSSGSSYSSGNGSSSSSPSSDKSSCPSLKINRGKWYCCNTGNCGMCGGDGLMDGEFGQGPNSRKCTLCGGSGKCKYCK